ncbi:hypothetical protein JHK82_042704 [Glycine max]|nr:hypothetical protein JHK82_042704 [Glycine max]
MAFIGCARDLQSRPTVRTGPPPPPNYHKRPNLIRNAFYRHNRDRFGVKFGSFEGFPGGVTDPHGGPADECDSAVAATAEPGEDNEVEEVAEVEGFLGGVEAAINLEGWRCQARAVESFTVVTKAKAKANCPSFETRNLPSLSIQFIREPFITPGETLPKY